MVSRVLCALAVNLLSSLPAARLAVGVASGYAEACPDSPATKDKQLGTRNQKLETRNLKLIFAHHANDKPFPFPYIPSAL